MTVIQSTSKTNREVSDEILRAVEELKQGSGFGSVEIVLHEGRVTQIEKREKLRFSQDSAKNQVSTKFTLTAKAAAK
ncbi:MAG: YezD family protein [Methylotenera sp.]|nr:YezD family protein [Methylotenera sp.]